MLSGGMSTTVAEWHETAVFGPGQEAPDADVSEHGIRVPVEVRDDGVRRRLMGGHHRYAAAVRLGITTMPADT